ncbi:DUF4878 domain-containing protein [Tsukamurella sp. 1534]|uniref:DUF4878 domain-containing protein n=1 Tax=Tsukamurella sp. 1534 TaxID=1151061 RepID=UPI0011D1D495|nr:DUF4878 domain-containing protein [Tsukamurella sp. 1534]
MNTTPPANQGFPGQNPADPHQETQLRPTWHGGEPPQQPFPAAQPSYPAPYPPYTAPQGVVGPGGPGGPIGPGAPKKPRPGWLIPAIIGGAALLLVIVLIAGIALIRGAGGGGGDTASPGATVKAYFAALQAGDAKKALSYGKAAPASTELLTDEVLRKQTGIAPIKDVTIVSEEGGYMGKVHLTVTIGDVAYDEEITLEKVGDEWKLAAAAVQTKPYFSYDTDKANLTVLGKDLPASGVVYTFPGTLDLGSKNTNLAVKKDDGGSGRNTGQASVKGLSMFGSISSGASVQFALSDPAKASAREQIGAKYAACAASKDRAPSGCPQADFTGENGSYTWTPPNAQEVVLDDTVRDGSVTFTDRRAWTFSAMGRDGRPVTGSDTGFVYGTVTVTQDAVAVSVR